jgi:uncharacterized membrane protein YhaH (DUF805 family)
MTLFDNTIATMVAILYNMAAHYTVSNSTKELPYHDKINKTAMAIIVAGILAIIFAKKIEDKDKDINKQVVSRGLWYGGLLLVITPVVGIWTSTTFDMQLITLVILLGGIIWLSNRYIEPTEEKTTQKNRSKSKKKKKFKLEDLDDVVDTGDV